MVIRDYKNKMYASVALKGDVYSAPYRIAPVRI